MPALPLTPQHVDTWVSLFNGKGRTDLRELFADFYAEIVKNAGDFDLGVFVRWYWPVAAGMTVAFKNHARALGCLGEFYKSRERTREDLEKEAYWFAKAVEEGDIFAQYCLGKCYIEGKGVKRAAEKGQALLAKAKAGWERASAEGGSGCEVSA